MQGHCRPCPLSHLSLPDSLAARLLRLSAPASSVSALQARSPSVLRAREACSGREAYRLPGFRAVISVSPRPLTPGARPPSRRPPGAMRGSDGTPSGSQVCEASERALGSWPLPSLLFPERARVVSPLTLQAPRVARRAGWGASLHCFLRGVVAHARARQQPVSSPFPHHRHHPRTPETQARGRRLQPLGGRGRGRRRRRRSDAFGRGGACAA